MRLFANDCGLCDELARRGRLVVVMRGWRVGGFDIGEGDDVWGGEAVAVAIVLIDFAEDFCIIPTLPNAAFHTPGNKSECEAACRHAILHSRRQGRWSQSNPREQVESRIAPER
jgi:hypothetical protein